MIQWFNVKERNGVASLYGNNITLNTTAMYPLDFAYRVQVGIDEDKNIIIKPLSKNTVESGVLDECCLLKLEIHKSFARISSTILMKQISDALGIELSKVPIQYETKWDSVENVLIVNTKGGPR
ncbi:MAG: hypothetical protein IJ787_02055 [Bacilli bacterium]|nr:hypothetical protein [Bacilli bacterium]MDY6392129.1 hypothetical protein [Bacilli bacterium]